MSDKLPSIPGLYCVDVQRSPRDLGLSVVLPAACELMARRETLRLFPELKHGFPLMQVSLARFVEVDWDSGRTVIAKCDRPAEIPPCVVAAKRERKSLPRLEEEGGAQ